MISVVASLKGTTPVRARRKRNSAQKPSAKAKTISTAPAKRYGSRIGCAIGKPKCRTAIAPIESTRYTGGRSSGFFLIGLRQTEDAFGDVAEDELRRDRRDAADQRLP